MYAIDGIHLSLDDARQLLQERWANKELRQSVEAELAENFMPMFKERPRAVSFRQLCSPDNGFAFFFQRAHYLNATPLVTEYHEDIFVHFNEEKKGLGRLRVVLENGEKACVDIMDFHANEKLLLGDCVIKTGEKLVSFHHNLFHQSGYQINMMDNLKWFRNFGRAQQYYYPFLAHFVAHGVWFENIEAFEDDEKGVAFIRNIISPSIEKIEAQYGCKPLVVRQYPNPETQTAEEDFYWWSYPPHVNDYIVKYAREHGLRFKPVKS
jgi:hypothetical protein